jgi:L-lactate dehydrogenase complex protein LldG
MLSKIKDALKREPLRAAAAASTDPEQSAGQIRKRSGERRGDLISQFENELKRVGGHFYFAGDRAEARRYVLRLVSAGMKKAVGWDCPVIQETGLAELLDEAGGEFVCDANGVASPEFLRKAIAADIGITGVDYALANTGTLVVLTGRGRARSASLLPPVHVALVKAGQIISGLDDLFALLKAEKGFSNQSMSSAVTFITGPSRTADIEMTLVVGVHGPQQLHVILLND